MKAVVITLKDSPPSVRQSDHVIATSGWFNDFEVERFEAVTPKTVIELFKERRIKWSYPWSQSHLCIATGLMLNPYQTTDPKKRMACFMSHYLLWEQCARTGEDFLVLEHDAEFMDKLDVEALVESKYQVISLNDPRGATRRAGNYHDAIIGKGIVEVPWIDERQVPQGLPGNSAYYIKPKGASKLISLVKEFGAWPNDAIMCKQLMPRMLGCQGNYTTQVRNTVPSSTTN